ncbi:MAG TPA: type IV pilus assembly protein PilM [Planctomycetaceae bacterium]|nr:type IV pilus assembly protein PilM [Planctomycetaceae bacterium]
MADSQGVWGIEIGQAGLKAIRLRYAEAADQVLAVAFDYIPHPKILSQPDAIPEELIPQALEKFLERNKVKGDRLAISVPGHTSLLKFIKLPPVEASKVAEIVKYEARQQIPFALDDVIWDYQSLTGGADEDTGFMLDAEVGLFAMKRDQLMGHLRPFSNAKLEIELIQSAPLAIFNMLSYDQLGLRNTDGEPVSDEHQILIDIGADNTTMLVTNGEKIWIRNIPMGGNHFTRALSKDMKLTFAKAEHLKCNATKSPDPKAVFQALRPVFNDFVAEIQRSIGYFSSVNREAKIARVVGVGNGFKMAGLQKFLEQNLQYEVVRLDRFHSVVGDSVLSDPLFEENILTFAVPYGLALQGLRQTVLKTSLLPPEILRARMIRHKKPWAIAAAAVLLFGFAASTAGYSNVMDSYSVDRFGAQEQEASSVVTNKTSFQSAYDQKKGELKKVRDSEELLVEPLKTREYWLELYRAINACLPRDVDDDRDTEEIQHQKRIKLISITSEYVGDLKTAWFDKLTLENKTHMDADEQATPPSGSGYVFTLVGIHYHNDRERDKDNTHVDFIVNNFLKNLQQWKVTPPKTSVPIPVGQIGISHPTIITSSESQRIYDPEGYKLRMSNERNATRGMGADPYGTAGGGAEYGTSARPGFGPAASPGFGPAATPGFGAGRNPRLSPLSGIPGGVPGVTALQEPTGTEIVQTDFVIQFIWKQTPPLERVEQPATTESENSNPTPTE